MYYVYCGCLALVPLFVMCSPKNKVIELYEGQLLIQIPLPFQPNCTSLGWISTSWTQCKLGPPKLGKDLLQPWLQQILTLLIMAPFCSAALGLLSKALPILYYSSFSSLQVWGFELGHLKPKENKKDQEHSKPHPKFFKEIKSLNKSEEFKFK